MPEARYPWTLTHGFYALMGGMAFVIPENLPESKHFLPLHRREVWFLDRWLIMLLSRSDRSELLPDLSVEEVKSKSKANGLEKTLVCIQALWFIAQCITRCT